MGNIRLQINQLTVEISTGSKALQSRKLGNKLVLAVHHDDRTFAACHAVEVYIDKGGEKGGFPGALTSCQKLMLKANLLRNMEWDSTIENFCQRRVFEKARDDLMRRAVKSAGRYSLALLDVALRQVDLRDGHSVDVELLAQLVERSGSDELTREETSN